MLALPPVGGKEVSMYDPPAVVASFDAEELLGVAYGTTHQGTGDGSNVCDL
jgi:hypothetical protein